MKRRKIFKSTIAMIALIAMLLENTYSVMASAVSYGLIDGGDQIITTESGDDSGLIVNDGGSDIIVEPSSGETDIISGSDSTAADEESVKEIDIIVDDVITDKQDTTSANIKAHSDRIEINGEDEITLYINTDQMNGNDSFSLDISGSSSIICDEILKEKLNKNGGGVYYITGLDKAKTVFEAVSLAEGMTVEYSVRADGNPQITLISKDTPKAVKTLKLTSDKKGIEGSGYDVITVTLDGSNLPSNAYYSVHIKTKANVMCNGKSVNNGNVPSLSRSTSGIRLSGLDNEAFTIYIKGENVDNISADYSVDSVVNGAVGIVLNDEVIVSDEEADIDMQGEDEEETVSENEVTSESVQRVYEYEDSKVSITVTLNDPADLPDDAQLHADEITMSDNEELFQQVNETLSKENTDDSVSLVNLYVYDIYFTL
nr:hypothetical protein [Lachnospiraceae bacterium]